jgi:hypothetical protein
MTLLAENYQAAATNPSLPVDEGFWLLTMREEIVGYRAFAALALVGRDLLG